MKQSRSISATQVTVAGLVLVLVALGAVISVCDVRIDAALARQEQAAVVDNAFVAARGAVLDEALAIHDFLSDPSQPGTADAVSAALDRADTSLLQALQASGLASTTAGVTLSGGQTDLDVTSRQVLRLHASADPSTQAVGAGLRPVVAVVSASMDTVAHTYHQQAQQRARHVRRLQDRVVTAQVVAGTVALLVVAVILLVLVRARRREQVVAMANAHAAVHDALTGLGNRAMIRAVGDPLVRRHAAEAGAAPRPVAIAGPSARPGPVRPSASAGGRLGLVLVDLDGFKPVNDTFGHAAGDVVLVAVAQLLRERVDSAWGDVLVRLGGDEFMVILPGRSPQQLRAWCLQTAQTLRCHVDLSAEATSSGRAAQVAVSASLGATSAVAGDTLEMMAGRADRAMYAAKHDGGLRMRMFEDLRRRPTTRPPHRPGRCWAPPRADEGGPVTSVAALTC